MFVAVLWLNYDSCRCGGVLALLRLVTMLRCLGSSTTHDDVMWRCGGVLDLVRLVTMFRCSGLITIRYDGQCPDSIPSSYDAVASSWLEAVAKSDFIATLEQYLTWLAVMTLLMLLLFTSEEVAPILVFTAIGLAPSNVQDCSWPIGLVFLQWIGHHPKTDHQP